MLGAPASSRGPSGYPTKAPIIRFLSSSASGSSCTNAHVALGSVSLFGGVVTARSVAATHGKGSVSGFEIYGSPVALGAGRPVRVGGWGEVTLGKTVGRLKAPLVVQLLAAHSLAAGRNDDRRRLRRLAAGSAQVKVGYRSHRDDADQQLVQAGCAREEEAPQDRSAPHCGPGTRVSAVALRLPGRRRRLVRRHLRRGTQRHLRRLASRRRPLRTARNPGRRGCDGEVEPRRLEQAGRLAGLAHRQQGQLVLLRPSRRLRALDPHAPKRARGPGGRLPRPHGRRVHDSAPPPLRDPPAPAGVRQARLRRRGRPDHLSREVARREGAGETRFLNPPS